MCDDVEIEPTDLVARMALARVVTFEGVSKDRMEEMDREMREGEQPDGLAATEIVVLHDPEAEQSVVILFFETEDDYKRGDEDLDTPCQPGGTPGVRRASVTKYNVRMTPDARPKVPQRGLSSIQVLCQTAGSDLAKVE